MTGALGGVPMTNAQHALHAAANRPTYGTYHIRDSGEDVLASAAKFLAWLNRQDAAAGRGEVQDT